MSENEIKNTKLNRPHVAKTEMGCQNSQKILLAQDSNINSVKLFDNLWDKKRLAEYLNIPIRTIEDWIYKRRIPCIRVGRHVRFKPSDVERWLEEGGGNGH